MSGATARGWTASSVPIVLWIAHLTALAALAQPLCTRPGLTWVPHALTAGLALACLPFLLMSAQLVRSFPGTAGAPATSGGSPAPAAGSGSAPHRTDETETPDDLHFLGWLGIAMTAASILLILAEGLIVLGIGPCL